MRQRLARQQQLFELSSSISLILSFCSNSCWSLKCRSYHHFLCASELGKALPICHQTYLINYSLSYLFSSLKRLCPLSILRKFRGAGNGETGYGTKWAITPIQCITVLYIPSSLLCHLLAQFIKGFGQMQNENKCLVRDCYYIFGSIAFPSKDTWKIRVHFKDAFFLLREMRWSTGHKMPVIMTLNRQKCCFLRQILSDSFYSTFVQSKMPCPLSPGLKLLRKTDISLTTLASGGKIFLLFPSEGQSSHNAKDLKHAHIHAHTHAQNKTFSLLELWVDLIENRNPFHTHLTGNSVKKDEPYHFSC